MQKNPKQLVATRPAETGAFAGAVAVLIAYLAGLDDPGLLAALTIVVGGIPGVITWCVVTFKQS